MCSSLRSKNKSKRDSCPKIAPYLQRACLLWEAFLRPSSRLSEGNYLGESARTVTRLRECDLAMSWLPSGQSRGVTWGPESHQGTERNPDLLQYTSAFFARLWAWNGWGKLLNSEVHNPIIVSEMRCSLCENGVAGSPFQLLRSLSCDKEQQLPATLTSNFEWLFCLMLSQFSQGGGCCAV